MYTLPITIDGKAYEIDCVLNADEELTCYMPDGSPRLTVLGGLKIERVIETHLRGYLQHPGKAT